MQGTVLKFDKQDHTGFISGHDGNRYSFAQVDWKDKKKIKEGMAVDFDIDGEDGKKARDVLPVGAGGKEPSKMGKILGWGFGLLWLVAGLAQFANGLVLTGICGLTAASMVLPPVTGFAHKTTGISLKPWMKIVIILVLMTAAASEYQQ